MVSPETLRKALDLAKAKGMSLEELFEYLIEHAEEIERVQS
jgi:hypothetical protein